MPKRSRPKIDRRRLLALTGIGLPTAMMGLGSATHATESIEAEAPRSPDEALAALVKGNAHYVARPRLCIRKLSRQRARVAAGQAPWATIVSCADSRVPPELIFGGLGLGELFVARNAGNLVNTAAIGTVEYGASVLGSPLIVVLGHSQCGAVAAACDVVTKNARFPGSIGPMIDPIVPAALAVQAAPGDFLDNAIRKSAQRTAQRLESASAILADLVEAGKLKIVAAHYDLDTGMVEFLK